MTLTTEPQNDNNIVHVPPPTLAKMLQCWEDVIVVRGPVGSAKTTNMCIKIMYAFMRMPLCRDGTRRARCIAVRNTYKELELTTIKTWLGVFPAASYGTIKYSPPTTHHLQFVDQDGIKNEFEVIFLALDREDDVAKLKSLETTFFFFNELSEISELIFEIAIQRVGRYPSRMMPDGALYWSGIFADTNSPQEESWLYDQLEKNTPKGYVIFTQPPAAFKLESKEGQELLAKGHEVIASKEGSLYIVNPLAENKDNLDKFVPRYYERIIEKSKDERIKIFVLNQYGSIFAGTPIYPNFNNDLHVATRMIIPNEDHDLELGWDFGSNPACIISQYYDDRMIVLAEIVASGVRFTDFLNVCVFPILRSARFENWFKRGRYRSTGDPSGNANLGNNGDAFIQILNESGIHTDPCITNNPTERWEAVEHFLTSLRYGRPALILDPSCKLLIDGFKGGYKYKELRLDGENKISNEALKNKYSHPHDGLQYICVRARNDAKIEREYDSEPQIKITYDRYGNARYDTL